MFAKTSTSFGATCSAVRALLRIERPKTVQAETPALVDPIEFRTDDDGQLRIASTMMTIPLTHVCQRNRVVGGHECLHGLILSSLSGKLN